MEARLAELTFKDYVSLQKRNEIVNATIEEFVTGLPAPRAQISGQLRAEVDKCFASEDINDIINALTALKDSTNKTLSTWATKTIDTMEQRSPTSVLVALRQLQLAQGWGIADTFRNEYNIASRFMEHGDFVEGVSARLVHKSKDRPNWQPADFNSVPRQEVEQFFRGRTQLDLLNTSNDSNYLEYPHASLGLPREKDILRKAQLAESDRSVVQHFVRDYNGKAGVKEKVEEVLERSRLPKE